MLGWHFTETNKLLRFGDGREVIAGKTLTFRGETVLCESGLHACKRLLDATVYAPGPYIWRVELSGTIVHGDDKSSATKRKALWGYDATDVLREFSRKVALDAILKFWDVKKFGIFPEVSRKWLDTGDESLRSAARYAARSAAESAAESAAWSAAEFAAESAAESAAEFAAESAAEFAAWFAAESASWSAAEFAARSAAWSAAEFASNKLLTKMILAGRPKQPRKKATKKS